MFGRLGSQPRLAQSVAKVNFVRCLGEAAASGRGECGPCSYIADRAPTLRTVPLHCILYPGICLKTEGKSWKTLASVTEKRSVDEHRTRFVWSTRPSLAMASTGLLTPAALGSRVRRRGQPSVSVISCRFAVQGGSPRQLTLSRSSQSGF